MNDKLEALKRYTTAPTTSIVVKTSSNDSEDDSEITDDASENEDLEIEFNHLKSLCDRLESNVNILNDIYQKNIVSAHSNNDNYSNSIQKDIIVISNSIRNHIKNIKPYDDIGSHCRMRQNIQMCISKRFVDIMNRYQQIQTQYRNDCEKNLKRQIKIIIPTAQDAEVDEMIENGYGSQLLQDSLIKGDRQETKDQATLGLMMIKEQHNEIMQLERDIAELYQIFVDMANLVDAQGEVLDRIVCNVENAEAWIGDAVYNQLPKARKYKTKERKKCCALCMSCVGLGGAIAGGIALGLAPLAACSIQ